MICSNTSKNTSFRWELRDRRKATELLELPITPVRSSLVRYRLENRRKRLFQETQEYSPASTSRFYVKIWHYTHCHTSSAWHICSAVKAEEQHPACVAQAQQSCFSLLPFLHSLLQLRQQEFTVEGIY